jgi:hypothetical protein
MKIKSVFNKIFRPGKLVNDGYVINIDYPIFPKVRYTSENPHAVLHKLFEANEAVYYSYLEKFAAYKKNLATIPLDIVTVNEPYWNNGWVERLDALSLYCMPVINNANVYFEVGSGNSTKFVRKAVNDFGLKTQEISLDPHPRAEIDKLCDKIYRQPLEDFDTNVITDMLYPGDILMIDNSHRGFQNSDVTVFFLDILPNIRKGVLLYIDDIFLPYDYPEKWLKRFYNEQYFLANTILSGNSLEVILPAHYCERSPVIKPRIDALCDSVTPGINGMSNGIWLKKN